MQTSRAICHLISVLIITIWAFNAWPMPWPGVLTGVTALVFTVLIWALFLSPRPVIPVDRFGQSLIELLLVGGAVAAMLGLGVPWVFAAVFFVLAAVLGYLAGRAD